MKYRIFPLGDNALIVDFLGNEISVQTNDYVLSLADFLQKNNFSGFIETVPAYSSLAVIYDAAQVIRNFAVKNNNLTAHEKVAQFIEKAIAELADLSKKHHRKIKIPVCFDAEFAFDLKEISESRNLTMQNFKEIFLERIYRVFMLGFLPGFAYMGKVDRRIAVARKSSPNLKIPAGSIGIAGRQTGIYSLESPGGWQIIGRTPLKTFTPEKNPPTFLQAGDAVEFYEIGKPDFFKIKNEF